MKLPIDWLKEYLEIPADHQKLIDKMTLVGHMQDGPPKEIAGDTVYDLEIRQNRPDCLSILGLAREAGAVLDRKTKYPEAYSQNLAGPQGTLNVEIKDQELCYRFSTIIIEGIKIADSPDWLRKRLDAYGIKSINNIVDITNFVMIELGQPLHPFDADKIEKRSLIIRTAKSGESLKILGGKEIELTNEDLIIADTQKTLALAGVIGGGESSVGAATKNVILESATYNQASIRRTSLRHQLRTEASTRLEKFLNPELTELALRRTLSLIQELCGGVLKDHSDNYPGKFEERSIELTAENLYKLGGVEIDVQKIKSIFEALEIPVKKTSTDKFVIIPPYFRTDLEQEADLIEEVLRIYGYDQIPTRLPGNPPMKQITSEWYELEEEIKNALTGFGYEEEITDPLTKEEGPDLEPVRLENSLNSDKVMLRTTLKNSLVNALTKQRKYRKDTIRLFEVGEIYFIEKGEYLEHGTLGLLMSGEDNAFEKLKGIIEALFDKLNYEFSVEELRIEKVPMQESTYFCEIDIENSFTTKVRPRVHTSPPQLILEDMSFLVPQNAAIDEVINSVKNISPLVYKVSLGEAPQMLDSQKTLLLKIAYHSPEKTITTTEIEPIRKKIVEQLSKNFNAKLR